MDAFRLRAARYLASLPPRPTHPEPYTPAEIERIGRLGEAAGIAIARGLAYAMRQRP